MGQLSVSCIPLSLAGCEMKQIPLSCVNFATVSGQQPVTPPTPLQPYSSERNATASPLNTDSLTCVCVRRILTQTCRALMEESHSHCSHFEGVLIRKRGEGGRRKERGLFEPLFATTGFNIHPLFNSFLAHALQETPTRQVIPLACLGPRMALDPSYWLVQTHSVCVQRMYLTDSSSRLGWTWNLQH